MLKELTLIILEEFQAYSDCNFSEHTSRCIASVIIDELCAVPTSVLLASGME